MPRKPKRPWNADLDLSKPGAPTLTTGRVLVGHSTAQFMPEPSRWHVAEVLDDGSHQLLLVGDHPWVGSQRGAETEAARLVRETGRQFRAVPAVDRKK